MCQADDDLLDAEGAGLLHQLVHRRDEAFTALQREPLLADVLGVEVTLQALGGRESLEDVLLLVGVEPELAAGGFQPLLDPAFRGRIGDMHVFGAD